MLVAGEAGIGKTRLATELTGRARDAGFHILLGRSIDLIGTELPYQPFVEALRPLGDPRRAGAGRAGSQLKVFEETLALLTECAASTPVLLVLEDLHWADATTLDLVVFLAHHLDDRRILLLVTYRADEPASADRMHRFAEGVRRSGSPLGLELGPLDSEAIAVLLAALADTPLPPGARRDGRSRGGQSLLRRRAHRRRRRPWQHAPNWPARPAAAGAWRASIGGRRACCVWPRPPAATSATQCCALFRASPSVMCVNPCARRWSTASSLPIRPAAASASATRSWPRRSTPRSSQGSARSCTLGSPTSSPAVERRHQRSSRPTGRQPVGQAEALVASVEAARQADAVFGLAEALAHLERALTLWNTVPDAAELAGLDQADLCTWAAELASRTGAAPHAVELAQQAIDLVDEGDSFRAALLYQRLGRYLFESGRGDDLPRRLRASRRDRPGSPALGRSGAGAGRARRSGLHVVWRHDESRAVCEQALELARMVGATRCRGSSAHHPRQQPVLSGSRRGGPRPAQPCPRGRPTDWRPDCAAPGLHLPHRRADDARTATTVRPDRSRPGSPRCAPMGRTTPSWSRTGSRRSSRSANGTDADEASANAVRAMTANYPHMRLGQRADLELGRGRVRRRTRPSRSRPSHRALRPAAWPPTTDTSPSSPSGSTAGWTPTMQSARAWHWRVPDGERRSASGSVRRGCAPKRSWQLSPTPTGMPTPSDTR